MSKYQEFVSPSLVQNLSNELLNALGNEVDKADTSLYERKTLNFRDIIDNNFPTMLIVDYDNIKSELRLYQDIDTALKTYISSSYTPTEKDYSVNKFSDKEIALILKAISLGIKQIPATSISYKQLQQQLNTVVETASSNNAVLQGVKRIFSKTYKLTDNLGSVDVFIFPNFARVGDILRKPLDIGLSIAEEQAELEVKGLKSIGTILNYGHTAAGYQDSEGNVKLNFNTPKLMAIMFEVLQSASESGKSKAIEQSLLASTSFVNDTRQTDVFLTIDKDFSEGFVKIFVSAGGNIVRFENSLINSRRGSVLEKTEKRGVNKAVLDRLATAFRSSSTTLGSRLARYIVNKKSSPNLIEYITYSLTSILESKKPAAYSGGSKDTSKPKKTNVSKQIMFGIAKQKIKLPKLRKPKTIVPTVAKADNLLSLQNLINQQLQDVVSANMGDGNSRTLLNYRTGRLASSAKVEYMSESRAGMITAFYSYMKNPYATFSDGGKQSSPRSRDPKLLISKSIREIAATQVGNRLRAVNV
jgi:hypothetical protein